MKFILAIAGSDPSGGAGIQADIKTITCLGEHALTVITSVTAQNSQAINGVHGIPARFISRQVETLIDDMEPHSVKVGMLYSDEAVCEVAELLKKYQLGPVVVDPVIRASTGKPLIGPKALESMKENLFPLVKVVTPNIYEAGILSDTTVEDMQGMEEAAKIINEMGPDVVVTGGHLEKDCLDILYDGKKFHRYAGTRIANPHSHGSGCIFSSSLATFLAKGENMEKAVGMAHDFTRSAIIAGYPCGKGIGPARPLPLSRLEKRHR